MLYAYNSTGGIYCDRSLRLTGFDGESIRSSAVLVVKAHDELPKWTADSDENKVTQS